MVLVCVKWNWYWIVCVILWIIVFFLCVFLDCLLSVGFDLGFRRRLSRSFWFRSRSSSFLVFLFWWCFWRILCVVCGLLWWVCLRRIVKLWFLVWRWCVWWIVWWLWCFWCWCGMWLSVVFWCVCVCRMCVCRMCVCVDVDVWMCCGCWCVLWVWLIWWCVCCVVVMWFVCYWLFLFYYKYVLRVRSVFMMDGLNLVGCVLSFCIIMIFFFNDVSLIWL